MPDKHGVGTFVTDELELAADSLDLFTPPPVENSLIHGKCVYYYPVTAINDNGPYEFSIPSDGNEYTYLPYTRLEGKIEVVKQVDGLAIKNEELVGLCNLFPQSLFSQIECYLNNVQICDISTPTYPYKSFIQTHLTFGDEAKNTTLACEYYDKETVGKEETLTLENKRFKKVHTYIKEGAIYFSMILHLDFFHSQRYLLPGCSMKLKFIRSTDNFSLLSATAIGKIKIHELKLRMQKITVDPAIVNAHEQMLESRPAIYPVTQSKIRTFLINSGVKDVRLSQIFRGKLPKSVIFSFVDAKGFNGEIDKNPFVFKNYGINYLNLYVNGEPVVPDVFQPDFSTKKYVREYRWFMDNIGIAHENETNGITMEDYKANSCFFAFDLSPDLCNSVHFHGTQTGTLDLNVAFKEELSTNIYCIVFASFNEIITIDKERQVSVEA